jgi:hypothetical protein
MALDDWCDLDLAYLLLFGEHPDLGGNPVSIRHAGAHAFADSELSQHFSPHLARFKWCGGFWPRGDISSN